MNTQLKVVDPQTGVESKPGDVGEILCQGPVVFKGYWDNPKATDEAIVDGWYRSDDLGKVDEEGYFNVVDRLKDMIISGGENIYPAELETVIMSHQSVAEVAVIGAPDNKWGEIPVAYVVRKPAPLLSPKTSYGCARKNSPHSSVLGKSGLRMLCPKTPSER